MSLLLLASRLCGLATRWASCGTAAMVLSMRAAARLCSLPVGTSQRKLLGDWWTLAANQLEPALRLEHLAGPHHHDALAGWLSDRARMTSRAWGAAFVRYGPASLDPVALGMTM